MQAHRQLKLGDVLFNYGLRLRLITDVVPTRRDLDADGGSGVT
jgi:hypothetical protein